MTRVLNSPTKDPYFIIIFLLQLRVQRKGFLLSTFLPQTLLHYGNYFPNRRPLFFVVTLLNNDGRCSPYLIVGTLVPFKLRPLCEENHVALCSYEGQNNVKGVLASPMKKAYHITGVTPTKGGQCMRMLMSSSIFVGCALQHDKKFCFPHRVLTLI